MANLAVSVSPWNQFQISPGISLVLAWTLMYLKHVLHGPLGKEGPVLSNNTLVVALSFKQLPYI